MAAQTQISSQNGKITKYDGNSSMAFITLTFLIDT